MLPKFDVMRDFVIAFSSGMSLGAEIDEWKLDQGWCQSTRATITKLP